MRQTCQIFVLTDSYYMQMSCAKQWKVKKYKGICMELRGLEGTRDIMLIAVNEKV